MAERIKLDIKDKALLNRLQENFPASPMPYEIIAKELGMEEDEALTRVRSLIDDGFIRSLTPILAQDKLGRYTALVATKAPAGKIDEIAGMINSYPEVTHNYERDHEYNIWFTLNTDNSERAAEIISEIKEKAGIEKIYLLPAIQTYKIRVKFNL